MNQAVRSGAPSQAAVIRADGARAAGAPGIRLESAARHGVAVRAVSVYPHGSGATLRGRVQASPQVGILAGRRMLVQALDKDGKVVAEREVPIQRKPRVRHGHYPRQGTFACSLPDLAEIEALRLEPVRAGASR
ncbi:MAG: hypothetical protein HY763_08890 [Planctomycetes bacterium]|nr:hypothetical protein [Planctomycetota bacterium]